MRKLIAALTATGAIAAVAAPALGAGATVRVDDNVFKTKTVRITKGSTVTWRWVGDSRHNVTFRSFKSRLQSSGSYRHRFTKAGTYRYFCQPHADQGMRGTVIVR